MCLRNYCSPAKPVVFKTSCSRKCPNCQNGFCQTTTFILWLPKIPLLIVMEWTLFLCKHPHNQQGQWGCVWFWHAGKFTLIGRNKQSIDRVCVCVFTGTTETSARCRVSAIKTWTPIWWSSPVSMAASSTHWARSMSSIFTSTSTKRRCVQQTLFPQDSFTPISHWSQTCFITFHC